MQLELLLQSGNAIQSDFYSYRYFASEGFLPGYNFPRLPLSAFIPGTRRRKGQDEFISRPRFLAISEFGPRSFIYHEGSKYIIQKAILPAREGERVGSGKVKQCGACGYLHPVTAGRGPDRCERCQAELVEAPLQGLFRLQNVAARRRERINSDEEERLRQGYEIRSGFRFTEHGGRPSRQTAQVQVGGEVLAHLAYGHGATLWRLNLGWRRRANPDRHGFVLDVEKGTWSNQDNLLDPDDDAPIGPRHERVIPYVEDHRNCLIVEPDMERLHPGLAALAATPHYAEQGLPELCTMLMASLQAALKSAIRVRYQLEENEIAVEALPERDARRLLLFYEAAEGGAGVLRRLVEEPEALPAVAREALALCHFDPDTGADLRRAPRAREDCEAACCDCLMSYSNQMDHARLDRQLLLEPLRRLAAATLTAAPSALPRAEHLAALLRQAGSALERRWLEHLNAGDYRLPSRAQVFIGPCRTRPDFFYDGEHQTAVYIDGPPHDYPERQARDAAQSECLLDQGILVVRFRAEDDWDALLAQYPHVFGRAP